MNYNGYAGRLLRVNRGMYDHYGIGVGGGMVVHFAGPRGEKLRDVAVRLATLDDFTQGGVIEVVEVNTTFTPLQIVNRALGQVGRADYVLASNNCEHWAREVVTGRSSSTQVAKVVAALGVGIVVAAVARA